MWCAHTPLHCSKSLGPVAPAAPLCGTIHPYPRCASRGSSSDGDSSREASPPSEVDKMHDADDSQPTAAAHEAIRQYDEEYGASDSNEEGDIEHGEEDSDEGGGGSGDGAGASNGRNLPPEAHDVFRQWLNNNPESGAKPTKDEIVKMAQDATAACGREITELQVRYHFENKYVFLCCSVLCWHMILRLVGRQRPGRVSLSPWILTTPTPHSLWRS